MTPLLGSWHGNMPQVCGRSPQVWWLMAPCRRTLVHPGLQSDNHRNPPGSKSQTFSKHWRRDEKMRWFYSTSMGIRHITYTYTTSDFLRTCRPCLRVQRLLKLKPADFEIILPIVIITWHLFRFYTLSSSLVSIFNYIDENAKNDWLFDYDFVPLICWQNIL